MTGGGRTGSQRGGRPPPRGRFACRCGPRSRRKRCSTAAIDCPRCDATPRPDKSLALRDNQEFVMTDIPRRSLAAGAGLLVGAMVSRAQAQQRKEEAQQLASANTPSLRAEPLPFNPDRIPRLSAKLPHSHHDDNYAGTVQRLNSIAEQLVKL